jgi:hypothetical protein
MHSRDLRQQHRISCASLLHVDAVRTPIYLQIKDVRSLTFIKDEQNLAQVPLARARLNENNLIDLRLQEAQVLVSHVGASSTIPLV